MEHQRMGSPGNTTNTPGATTNTPSTSSGPSMTGGSDITGGSTISSGSSIGSTGNISSGSDASSGGSVTSTAVHVVKEQGQRAIDRLRQNAIAKVEDQKSMACEQVETLANGLRKTGETLQREGSEPFGRLATTAADKVQRVGSYLQRTDVDGVLRDFSSVARRHPTAVFGTALVAGVLLGRFLRSSSPSNLDVVLEPEPSMGDSSFGRGSTGSFGMGSSGSTGIGNGTTPSSTFGSEPPTGGWA